MRLPPLFKDLPNDAVRRVIELFNQPQLIQSVTEAAKQVGSTTEWGTAQVQDSMRQAKRWIDTLSGQWSKNRPPSTTPIVNATGDIFSAAWAGSPMSTAAATAAAGVLGGYADSEAITAAVEHELRTMTEAESVLVVHNVATALQCLAVHAVANHGWIVPRSAALRLPDGGDVFPILQRFGTSHEIGAINGCTSADLATAISSHPKAQVFSVWPNLLSSAEDDDGNLFASTANMQKVANVELRFDASLCDLSSVIPGITPVKDRLAAGVTSVVFPGNAFLGGPRCGIIAGRQEFVDPLRESVRAFGFAASAMTSALLLGSLEENRSVEQWSLAPLGSLITTSLVNQMNRAKRLAQQLEASPAIARAEVFEAAIAIGPAPWTTQTLPSAAIKITPAKSIDEVQQKLRSAPRSVLGKVVAGQLHLYLRTIDPADDRFVAQALTPEQK